MTGQVELSFNNGVAQIVLARPEKHNAITREMALELARICREIDENNDIRVATITGAGDRAFSAGSDLNALADISDIWAFRNRVEYAAVVRDIRKPVIAGLKGWVLGGGMEIALSADIRIAGRSARIGGPEVTRGWVGGGGASQMLPRLVGYGQTMLPRAGARTAELAAIIASYSPTATQAVKAAVRAAMSMPLEAGLRYENEIHVACMADKGRSEGIKAFQEKRPARF